MHLVVSMAVGALIGLFTNWLAIRMLFQPRRAWHLGRWRVPLTPGLVPRTQPELARKIGETVENHLVSGEDISKLLKSPDGRQHIDDAIRRLADSLRNRIGFVGGLVDLIRPTASKVISDTIHWSTRAALKGLPVGSTVQAKIDALPAEELERLAIGVGRRHLRTITLLGAPIGAAIGLCQALVLQAL